MAKVGGVIFLSLFGLFWCGMTFVADAAVLASIVRQIRVYGYAETVGTVTESKVTTKNDGEGDAFEAVVRFRYEVAGRTYDGSRVRYDPCNFGRQRARDVVAAYPARQAVTVYYNPSAADDAVLEQGLDVGGFLGLLFLTPFNAVAVGFVAGLFVWARSKSLGRPIGGIRVQDDGLNAVIRIYAFSPACSAVIAWGAAGFLSTFGVLLLSWLMTLESAVVLGWSATLAATMVAWRRARTSYVEIRRDCILGNVTLRERDGVLFSLQPGDLQPARYSHRREKDSEGDLTDKYTLYLPFHDREGDQPRTLKLSEQSNQEDAVQYVAWLNDVLGLQADGKREETATILER